MEEQLKLALSRAQRKEIKPVLDSALLGLRAALEAMQAMEEHHRWHHEQEGRAVESSEQIGRALVEAADAEARVEWLQGVLIEEKRETPTL